MGKKLDATVNNLKLAKIATGTRITFCSAEPANYAGIAAVKLCSANLTAASGTLALAGATPGADGTSGSFTFSTSGNNRRLTVAAVTGMVATAGAPTNAVYACIDDGTTLLMGTTVPAISVTSGQTYNGNAITYDDSMIPT